jgi:hypothetical protein
MKKISSFFHARTFRFLLLSLVIVLLASACEDQNLNLQDLREAPTAEAATTTTSMAALGVGLQGFVYERLPDNSIGSTIAFAKIIYTKTDDASTTTIYSSSTGYHKADLAPGSYYVTVVHPSFEIYTTAPGVVIVTSGYSTFNIFLKKLTYGFAGTCYERKWDGTIGGTLASVKITFTKDDNLIIKTVYSNASGSYSVSLPAGKYIVTASKDNYYDYSSSPGFFVVTGTDGYQTGNIFLKRKLIIVPLGQ